MTALDEAIEFLKIELADGSMEASQIFANAKQLQIAEKTLKRAKRKLGVFSNREGEPGKKGGGRFVWQLPEKVRNDLEGQTYIYGPLDPLNKFSLENTKNYKTVGPLNSNNHQKELI